MRIREVMEERGVTAAELARRMRCSVNNVNTHINGNPTVRILQRFADALGVPVSELFDEPSIVCPRCGERIKLKVK